MYNHSKLLYGVAVNDADYVVQPVVQGKSEMCPYYDKWVGMIGRVNKPEKYPTYAEVSICEEWKYFSAFKKWMEKQDWQGKELDKDILIKGNKQYGPDTCRFVPQCLNKLLNTRGQFRGEMPLGVYRNDGRFRAAISHKGSNVFLGRHPTPEQAHKAWQWEKANQIEKAVAWYAVQDCFRTDVADALTQRVWQLRLDYTKGVETKTL